MKASIYTVVKIIAAFLIAATGYAGALFYIVAFLNRDYDPALFLVAVIIVFVVTTCSVSLFIDTVKHAFKH